MSFYSDASLVMIPSGYKDQKVYCAVPTDGLGDLTFSRASDATRVQSDGLIEKVRTNFKIQSEALTTAAGGLSFTDITTITANTTETLDPFGTNKAEKFDGTIGQVADTYNSISTFVPNTSSIYAKAGTATSFDLRMSGGFSAAANAVFNLSNGTVTSSGGGELISSKIEFVGNGWYRCSISYNFTNTPTNRIALTANGNVYFFGWQLEATDFGPTDYIATTTAAVSVGITADIPRLDYTGGGCPSLLLEPQRTNFAIFSEQMNNAAYSKFEATISANATASPDGFTNADKLVENTANDIHAILLDRTFATDTYVYSFFAKAAGRSKISVFRNSASIATINHVFDLAAGTATGGGKIEPYGNGFFRCSGIISVTAASTGVGVYLDNGSGVSYTGDGTSGIFLWGWQYELGSYVSSYIPTLGSSVTRLEDVANKTGISSLIGATEGTLFGEFYWDGNPIENWIMSVQTSATNFVAMFLLDDGRPYFYILNTSVVQMAYIGTALTVGYHKMAFGYAENNSVAYVDGVLKNTDTSCTIPVTSELRIGSVQSSHTQTAKINQAALYTTRLSNAELATLTAL